MCTVWPLSCYRVIVLYLLYLFPLEDARQAGGPLPPHLDGTVPVLNIFVEGADAFLLQDRWSIVGLVDQSLLLLR